MRPSVLLLHVANTVLPALALFILDHPLAQLATAVLLFFGLFTLMHDAMHGALGLRRHINEWVIGVSGVLVGVSGHTTRWFHLRHHAHPLEEDDVEGRGAVLSLRDALLEAPSAWLSLPFMGWRRAPARIHGVAAAEWLGVGVFGALSLAVPALRMYLGAVLAAQLTIPLWASRVPHRPPPLLMGLLAGSRGRARRSSSGWCSTRPTTSGRAFRPMRGLAHPSPPWPSIVRTRRSSHLYGSANPRPPRPETSPVLRASLRTSWRRVRRRWVEPSGAGRFMRQASFPSSRRESRSSERGPRAP